jgi:chromosome segregation ATPase
MKIKEEQLAELKELQQQANQIQAEMGSTEMAMKSFEDRKNQIWDAAKENQTKVQAVLKEIQSELGEGSIDISTGEFTPAEPKAETMSVVE